MNMVDMYLYRHGSKLNLGQIVLPQCHIITMRIFRTIYDIPVYYEIVRKIHIIDITRELFVPHEIKNHI